MSLAKNWVRTALAVSTMAAVLGASMGEASAQYRRYRGGPSAGAVAAGVVGGLALGALAAGAARNRYYYDDPYYAPAPVYAPGPVYVAPPPRPACWYEREDFWNGYAYVPRRVRVCN